jgi:hypothetical protein
LTEAAAIPAPSDLLPVPHTAETAPARIAELEADPAFREKYLSGETGAVSEFTQLHGVVSKGPADADAMHRSMQISAMQPHADLPPAA